MSDSNLPSVEQMVEQVAADLDNITEEQLRNNIEELAEEYSISEREAVMGVASNYEIDIQRQPQNEDKDLADFDDEEQWGNVEVKVVELWDSDNDAVGQVGLIADESGRKKFTAWAKSDLPRLEEGESYRLESVVSDEYQGRINLKLNSSTNVEVLAEEIEENNQQIIASGAVVSIQNGSGLIKRCPEDDCTRAVGSSGECREHGKVDGVDDLRLKLVIDDGQTLQQVVMDREQTEEIIDLTLEEAIEVARDAMDRSVIADCAEEKLIGTHLMVEGGQPGSYLICDDFDEVDPEPDALESTLEQARKLQEALEA